MKLSLFTLLAVLVTSASAFAPTSMRLHRAIKANSRAPRVAPLQMGLFGKTQAEVDQMEEEMKGMSEQERLNYISWKQTNSEADVMTYASLLTCIPLGYFLWLGLLADNGADI
eukprot:CAMPEP_0119470906 /NCGR_PEP_ID=MMETSP1344-20130328/3607_1 /TAXON_ID=236787 /ORGANISM="Florenciella parvula, Strain CCMP2471" /LENGTH=112 /DNA_ID=CAMNT_0007503641 /DNA_START=33 /DNA_END=371 /DNA_ORIENTATION=-